MNTQNVPPPLPSPAPSSSSETAPSISVPPISPLISLRVPGAATSAAVEFAGPPGTQLTIPALPTPAWKWITMHGTQIAIAISVALLFGLGRMSEQVLLTIFGMLITAQMPPIGSTGQREVVATAPPSPK